MEPFLTLEEVKDSEIYPENFDESLAPLRYHKLRSSLPNVEDHALVVHGVRRSGKTYAGIKLGEAFEEYGYKMLYYEVRPNDKYFNPYKSAEVSAKLIEEIKQGSKLFVMLDEAFNVPVYTRKIFLEPFRRVYEKIVKGSVEGNFFILFSGSYLYDPTMISAYIRRVFGNQRRTGLLTIPRLKPIRKLETPQESLLRDISSNPNYFNLNTLAALVDLTEGSIINFQRKTLGMPSVISGVERVENVVDVFMDLIQESFSGVIDVREKIDRKLKTSKVELRDVARRLSELLENQKRAGRTKGDLIDMLALFTGLVLPRRYIEAEEFEDRNSLIERLRNHDIGGLKTRATPSTVFSLEALRRILRFYSKGKFSTGKFYEALISHALITNALFYGYDQLGYIHQIPIFSTGAIDFIYVSPKDPEVYMFIEVKRSFSDKEAIIKSILKASRLGGILFLATTDIPGLGVETYKISHSKDFEGYSCSSNYVTIRHRGYEIEYKAEEDLIRIVCRALEEETIFPPVFINVETLAEILGFTILTKKLLLP